MKGRALFESDSSDDENTSLGRHGFADPLDAARHAAPPADETRIRGNASTSFTAGAPRHGPEAVPVPESSRVTATRWNLSQLFGSAAPAITAAAAAGAAPAALNARSSVPPLIADDASRLVDERPSAAATVKRSFFAPSFEYDPSTAGSRSRRTADAVADAAAEDSAAAALAGADLLTAEHAIVQAYRNSVYSGTCMIALCVPTTAASASSSSGAAPPPPPSVALQRHLEQQQQQQRPQGERAASAARPVLLLMSGHRQVLCRLALDDVFSSPVSCSNGGGGAEAGVTAASFQLRQDAAQPQYLVFYDAQRRGGGGLHPARTSGGSADREGSDGQGGADEGCWWTCMFPDRHKASRFLVAAYTVAQYAAALAKRSGASTSPVPSVRALPAHERTATTSTRADEAATVQPNVAARLCWQAWGLRRVSRQTLYCVPSAECAEAATSPRTVVPRGDGCGPLWDCVAEAVVGMRSGASRLVYAPAGEARLRHPAAGTSPGSAASATPPGMPALDTPAVVYVTCADAVVPEGGAAESLPPQPQRLPPPPQAKAAPSPTAAAPAAATLGAADPLASTAVLQQLLLHTLQQQQPQQATAAAALVPGLDVMERSLERVQLQLSSLYEKIDRLDIDTKLRHNNAELERVMRRVVGLAPQDEVAVEDTLKDRDALLASIERYRNKYEEANTNYQRALEAMGRLSDRAQALERDLHLQQDLSSRQHQEAAEQARLRLIERDARHRDELARISEERYAAGKSDGHAAGYREGRQATLLEVEGGGGVGGDAVTTEWRAKLMAKDQEVLALQTALQDARFHHERDRRQLRAEIDVWTELNEKLQHLQANADVRLPEETAQQQCKRVKRTLNAVYAQAEAELLRLPAVPATTPAEGAEGQEAPHLVAVEDALAVLMTAIRAEAQTATAQIREDEARRVAGNAALRDRIAARRGEQAGTSAEARLRLAWSSAGADAGAASVTAAPSTSSRGADVSAASRLRQTTPPPLPPPAHTAASHDALAAMEATLLPGVAQAASAATDMDRGLDHDTGDTEAADAEVGDASPPRDLPARPTMAPFATTVAAPVAAATPQDGVNEGGREGEEAEGSRAREEPWASPGVAVSQPPGPQHGPLLSGFQAAAYTAPVWMRAEQNPFVAQQQSTGLPRPAPTPTQDAEFAEAGDSAHSAPSSASSTSPVALPSRMATRLPADPAAAAAEAPLPPWRSAHEREDETGVDRYRPSASPPPDLAPRAVPGVAATRMPPPPAPPGAAPSAPALGSATASATPLHDAANFSSPSTALRDWQGTRLFTSPPSAPG